MKINITIVLATVYLLLSSCGGASINSKNAKNYSLNIVCTDRISSNESREYPKEIVGLCKPIDLVINGKFFMPNPVTIIRLLENKQPYQEELPILNGIETNFKSHQNRVDAYFIKGKGKEVSKQLLENNIATFDEIKTLNSYLVNLGKREKIFYYSKKPKSDSLNNQKLFNDIDTLKFAISKFLNDSPGYEIYVIYNMPQVNNVDTSKTKNVQEVNSIIPKLIQPLKTAKKSDNKTTNVQHAELNLGTLTYSYAKYHGETKNQVPCGDGTMTFLEDHIISRHDSRVAKKGDKIIGYWVNGEISNGKWVDSEGKLKEKIFIGTTGDCK